MIIERAKWWSGVGVEYVQSSGQSVKLIIRRLQCKYCKKIHHELPNILVPYKRHEAASIEQAVTEVNPAVAADESTFYRWRSWFKVWAARGLPRLSFRFHLAMDTLGLS